MLRMHGRSSSSPWPQDKFKIMEARHVSALSTPAGSRKTRGTDSLLCKHLLCVLVLIVQVQALEDGWVLVPDLRLHSHTSLCDVGPREVKFARLGGESHMFLLLRANASVGICGAMKVGCDSWRELLAMYTLEASQTAKSGMVKIGGASIQTRDFQHNTTLMRSLYQLKTKHKKHYTGLGCVFNGEFLLGTLEEYVSHVHKTSIKSVSIAELPSQSRVTLANIWIADTLTHNFDRSLKGQNLFSGDGYSLVLLDTARWYLCKSVKGRIASLIQKYHGPFEMFYNHVCSRSDLLSVLLLSKAIVDEICGLEYQNACEALKSYLTSKLDEDAYFSGLEKWKNNTLLDVYYGSSENGKKRDYRCLNTSRQSGRAFLVNDAVAKMQVIQADIHHLYMQCIKMNLHGVRYHENLLR